jgi:transmembrane sensor
MENKNARKLLKKYLNGTCTPDEKAIIESWYGKEAEDKTDAPEDRTDYSDMEKEIWSELEKRNKPESKSVWFWFTAVAAALTIISSIVYFSDYRFNKSAEINYSKNKISPGANKAILVLSDGSKIDLNDAQYGVLINQSGVRIKKAADGQLVYDIVPDPSASSEVTYNTIVTPRGGQFQVNLPDGTKVWLNASSSIKFPTIFDSAKRLVEISGEAYFEVSKMMIRDTEAGIPGRRMPFIVKSAKQKIEVLGTHFNVNAYADEESVRTTLLEGSVKVTQSDHTSGTILKPGEQSTLQNNIIKIASVDKEETIAWKNGNFQFNSEDIGAIMRKIARWYDVDIVYHKDLVSQRFAGTISRFEDVSKVLHMLELTGSIHFKIEGRRIIVMP